MKKVLVDIDNILAGIVDKKNRTGLWRTSYQIIERLMEKCESLTFLTNRYTTYSYKKLQLEDPKFRNFECLASHYENALINYIIDRRSDFRGRRRLARGAKKIIFLIPYLFFSLLSKIAKLFTKHMFNKKVLEFGIYQSLFYRIPDEIMAAKNIKKFIFVHDILPLTRSRDFKKSIKRQRKISSNFYKIFANLDGDVTFFFNSESTRRDFLDYFPQFRQNVGVVAPLAADEKMFFRMDFDENSSDAAENSNESENILNKKTKDDDLDEILNKYAIPSNKKYILSLSSLNPRKNLLFLVSGFRRFLDENPNIDDLYLVLAGPKGWQIENLFSDLEQTKAHRDRIILTGFVDDADLNYLYNGAFCFIFPSLYEGFGLPVLEAMACGLPVISSNVSSMPEVYGDAALPIDPTNEDELVRAISQIYEDKSLRDELIKKALVRAKQFTWDGSVDRMLERYEAA